MLEAAADVDMRSLEGKVVKGAYTLRGLIGEGAFGAVFRSEQCFLDSPVRRVAVKVTRRAHIEPAAARELLADALLLAHAVDRLDDAVARSHLVQLFDVGIARELQGRGFVVMEYVQGSTLADQFGSYGRVPAGLLLKWTRQMCRALAGLHALVPPMLHRDVKPDNVMLGLDLAVRLVDFGLAAKVLELGYAPGVAGTLAYMAPETTQGSSVPASDVYSVGLLLYQGLTGTHPFAHLVRPLDLPDALHAEWLYDAKRTQRVPPPPSVVPGLGDVVAKCLSFNPLERFADAGELLAALDSLGGPASASASEGTVEEARGMRAAGDAAGARGALERGLAEADSPATRFALLSELGDVLADLGDGHGAAARLVEAWELNRRAVVLRSRAERAQLVARIAHAYRRAGNAYQARRYEELEASERRS